MGLLGLGCREGDLGCLVYVRCSDLIKGCLYDIRYCGPGMWVLQDLVFRGLGFRLHPKPHANSTHVF